MLEREEIFEWTAACGSNSRSQSSARSNRLMRWNGCRSLSATMPKLWLPEPSGISQNQ
jgi:hypothetical protein